MTNPPTPKTRPGLRQRQAVALRENLKRRKAQEKSRTKSQAAAEQAADRAAAHDSAGIGADKRED
jgi:hypothetical protein